MTIDEIKELIQVLQETGIAELEVQRGDERVRIRRATPQSAEVVVPTMIPVGYGTHSPTGLIAGSGPSRSIDAPTTSGEQPEPEQDKSSRDVVVKSPIVGTYYDAPSPGSAVFVKVGDRVEPKQVLCIIESMKLMNEIEAEISGVVTAKLVENGRPVEYGESLFTIRPL